MGSVIPPRSDHTTTTGPTPTIRTSKGGIIARARGGRGSTRFPFSNIRCTGCRLRHRPFRESPGQPMQVCDHRYRHITASQKARHLGIYTICTAATSNNRHFPSTLPVRCCGICRRDDLYRGTASLLTDLCRIIKTGGHSFHTP